jgi:hypothetical protein
MPNAVKSLSNCPSLYSILALIKYYVRIPISLNAATSFFIEPIVAKSHLQALLNLKMQSILKVLVHKTILSHSVLTVLTVMQ